METFFTISFLLLVLIILLAPYIGKWAMRLWLRHIAKKMGFDQNDQRQKTQSTSRAKRKEKSSSRRIFSDDEGTYVDFEEQK